MSAAERVMLQRAAMAGRGAGGAPRGVGWLLMAARDFRDEAEQEGGREAPASSWHLGRPVDGDCC